MWPDPQHTRDLLDQADGGDAAAVDQLLAEHREPLRRAVGLRLDPALARRVDASDIVQDVMLEANRRLRDYLKDPSMPFALWLRQLGERSGSTRESVARVVARQLLGQQLSGEGDGNTDERR